MDQKIKKQNNLKPHSNVVKDIVNIINTAQAGALRAVNTYLVIRNWLIGKRIDEEILTTRSNDYGKYLIKNLSIELSKYGKGFNESDLRRFRNFYLKFPNLIKFNDNEKIVAPLVPESILPWSFYRLLLPIKNKAELNWYINEIKCCGWSKKQLERNIKTDYYHRVLSHQINHKTNQLVEINPMDYLKSPLIFEFLGFKPNQKYKEYQLEQALIDNINKFLLELGKGYSYIGRQIHLRSNNNDYYVDLVFYNTVLKCFVLVDLKIGKIQHKDIGQMLIYLDLYDKQYKKSDDKPSIGIILSSDTNGDIVKYLTLETNNHVVNSKYLTYLPTKQELLNEINKYR